MRFKRETCSPTETTYQDKSNNNTVDCIGKSTAMADKDDDRPPKIPILDRKNWRQWFKMTKLHIVQKGWGYAITNNMAACRALHVNSGVAEFDEAIYKMEKAQAGAELFVIQHINDMDNELIEEITEFNAKWAKLEEKYKRVTPQELRNKFTRLTTWKLKDGVTAEEGWLEIYSIRKEIVEAEARQRDILTEDIVFGFFIQGLPERFNITIEAIDAQNLDFTTKFEKIRAVDETAALKKATALDSDGDTAMAMMAQSRGRQDRGDSMETVVEASIEDHVAPAARDCPHREGIKAYIKENPIKKSSSPPKNRTSSNWRNRESSPNSLSFRPARDRGYVAAEASDEDEVHHLPRLGASLLSARSFCGEFKAKGAFNDKKMYFHRNGKILLSANNFHGIYVIANTIKNDFDTAFPAEETEEEVPAELEDIIYDESKTWIICLEKKSDIIIELEKWRIRVERESGFLVGATRTDNAPEIEKVLQEWQDKLGTQRQSTCIYTSNQNGTAEHNQQRDVNMPARKRQVSPHEAWTGIVPSIAHIKMWGSKCYSHVDPASHPSGARRDKLMDRARIGVFVGYNDHTTKQLWIYAPDRHAVIKTSNCTFFEGSPGGKVDLKLRSVTSGGDFVEGQGIQNILPDRRPVGRPRIYPVASVRTMPIGTAEPEVATNVEESELEPITQLQSTTTPQVKWNMLGQ
ncbi:hypothetical protein H4I96_03633 [Botrytis cinerea]